MKGKIIIIIIIIIITRVFWLSCGVICVILHLAIYIIKIGRFVCGQLCDWSARSAGLACAQRRPICAGGARAQRGPVIQAENERSEFSACFDTIPECDRQTHKTDTRRRHIPRLA